MGAVKELTPEEIMSRGLFERSSIEGQMRRKAELDMELLRYSVMINGATQIALTFLDHYDPESENAKFEKELGRKSRLLIDEIEKEFNIPVTFVDTGKAFDNIIDMRYYKKSFDWDLVENILNKIPS